MGADLCRRTPEMFRCGKGLARQPLSCRHNREAKLRIDDCVSSAKKRWRVTPLWRVQRYRSLLEPSISGKPGLSHARILCRVLYPIHVCLKRGSNAAFPDCYWFTNNDYRTYLALGFEASVGAFAGRYPYCARGFQLSFSANDVSGNFRVGDCAVLDLSTLTVSQVEWPSLYLTTIDLISSSLIGNFTVCLVFVFITAIFEGLL